MIIRTDPALRITARVYPSDVVPYSRVVRLRAVCAPCNRRPGPGYSVPANRRGALTLRFSEAHPRRPRRRARAHDAKHDR
jgi:hypothetical protein